MLYFAYGANMNREKMKERCPGSRFLKTVRLDGHRFVYDGYSVSWQGASGDIVPSETEFVMGALYEITEKDKLELDAHEGYPKSYDRKPVKVTDAGGETYEAWAYFRTGRPVGKPHPDYEQVILKGAADCKLPEAYIQKYLRVPRL